MDDLYHIADKLGNLLSQQQATLCTVESCTGGGIACALTAVHGSSQWFDRGWVTYSNSAKQQLGVPETLLTRYGAVSEEVVKAMAQAGLQQAKTHYAIAVTGIAGPAGGTPDKPVGTVWVAWAMQNQVLAKKLSLTGERADIRRQTIAIALQEAYGLWEVTSREL